LGTIDRLIPDIYNLLEKKDGSWFTDDTAKKLSSDISLRLVQQLGKRSERTGLRLSAMGKKCPRALWYSIHHPELGESLPAWATFKYSFGHVIEALAITLARCAGHEVTGEQDVISVDGVQGHRDCVIDGCIVDVKSTSSFGFKKFKEKTLAKDDPFGYLDQLDGYLVGSHDDPLVRVKDKAYIFAIDKQLGHMCLYEHNIRPVHIRQRIESYKEIVALDVPPRCGCTTLPDGKSGNIKLDVQASYSPFKHCCFPHLRTFLYASGPVYLCTVARKPDVTEVDKDGNIVYN
jgi:hypothetical protein